MPFGSGEQLQPGQRPLRGFQHATQQVFQVTEKPHHRRAIEQIAREGQGSGDSLRRLGERHVDVELRHGLTPRNRGEPYPGQRQLPQGRVLQRESHLEKGGVHQASFRGQLFDQLFERQVLVRIGIEGLLSDLAHQPREARGVPDLRAQHESVDEKSDQPLRLQTVAAGDRRSHRHFLLTTEAAEQNLERRQQGHEQRYGMVA